MKSFRRLSTIDQAEIALEQGLAEGRWTKTLPSYKTLCQLLGVSAPTVALAVNRLVERGLLVSPGNRQRFRITDKARKAAKSGGGASDRRHLLAIFPLEPDESDQGNRRIVLEAIRCAVADGWECSQEAVDYLDARRPKRRWDDLLQHRPTHVLLAPGTRTMAEWARRHGLKVAGVGGQFIPPEVGSTIGFGMADILGHCAEQLHLAGHHRIMMPLWADLPGLAEFAARVIARRCRTNADRLLAEGWVTQWTAGTPESHRRQLGEGIARLRPTAIITFSWRDHLVASQCAAAAGLRVPDDLSLVTLNPGVDTDWTLPLAAHYRTSESALVKGVRLWRQDKPVSNEMLTQGVLESWRPGQTFGPAPSRA